MSARAINRGGGGRERLTERAERGGSEVVASGGKMVEFMLCAEALRLGRKGQRKKTGRRIDCSRGGGQCTNLSLSPFFERTSEQPRPAKDSFIEEDASRLVEAAVQRAGRKRHDSGSSESEKKMSRKDCAPKEEKRASCVGRTVV